jgi:hypothetical protein
MTQTAAMALDLQREEAGHDLVARKQFDIANLSDEEFQAALGQLRLRQARMQEIIATALIEGAHYGKPTDKFKKKILYQAGAQELRKTFRLKTRVLDSVVQETEEYVSARVTVAIEDIGGRLLAPKTAACNSREKRFRRFDGKGWTYEDAREVLNDCLAMAEKRAATRCTVEVTGAGAFFANEAEMEEGLAERDGTDPEPWTDEERKAFMDKAKGSGVKSRDDLQRLILKTLGRESPIYSTDLKALYAALDPCAPGTPA